MNTHSYMSFIFSINFLCHLCNDELSLLHIMTHNHVEEWACPRSAGARLSTRETGNEARGHKEFDMIRGCHNSKLQ